MHHPLDSNLSDNCKIPIVYFRLTKIKHFLLKTVYYQPELSKKSK